MHEHSPDSPSCPLMKRTRSPTHASSRDASSESLPSASAAMSSLKATCGVAHLRAVGLCCGARLGNRRIQFHNGPGIGRERAASYV